MKWIKRLFKKKKPYRMTCSICPDEDTYKCKACKNSGRVNKAI